MERETNEYTLALRARAGDQEALAELVERTRLRLFALAYAELRHYEDAQDAVASALLQICLHVHELREPERVRAWMLSIVRNEVNRLRRSPGASTVSIEEADWQSDEAEPSLLRLDIERALRRLPGDQANAIRLYYLDDLPAREIARRMGRAEGTVTSWLHRARRHLAAEMEDYAPMTVTKQKTPVAEPSRSAALIHTELPPALVQGITEVLRSAGYRTTHVTDNEPARVLEALKGCQLILLDEGGQGHSALEYLVHIRAAPETEEIPVNVLCSHPPDFTISAYFLTGVARLIRKDDPQALARLREQLERDAFWQQFTERALKMVAFAREEAIRLGENHMGTEHLLLGLTRVPDSVGARILVERLGISLETIRTAVDEQAVRGPGYRGGKVDLTPRGKRVLDLAYEESRRLNNNYLGAEHLLLGLLRETYGLAARVLMQLGASLESVRREVEAMQPGAAPPDSSTGAPEGSAASRPGGTR